MKGTQEVSIGYEQSIFVKKPAEKFNCPLCLHVLRDAKQCSKGHSFCAGCVENLTLKRSNCPVCDVGITSESMVRNLLINEIIDEKETFCPTCDLIEDKSVMEHCLWTGELHTREKHVVIECGFVVIPCPNDGCKISFQRRLLQDHLSECGLISSVPKIINDLGKLIIACESDEVGEEENDEQPVQKSGKKKAKRKSKPKKKKLPSENTPDELSIDLLPELADWERDALASIWKTVKPPQILESARMNLFNPPPDSAALLSALKPLPTSVTELMNNTPTSNQSIEALANRMTEAVPVVIDHGESVRALRSSLEQYTSGQVRHLGAMKVCIAKIFDWMGLDFNPHAVGPLQTFLEHKKDKKFTKYIVAENMSWSYLSSIIAGQMFLESHSTGTRISPGVDLHVCCRVVRAEEKLYYVMPSLEYSHPKYLNGNHETHFFIYSTNPDVPCYSSEGKMSKNMIRQEDCLTEAMLKKYVCERNGELHIAMAFYIEH